MLRDKAEQYMALFFEAIPELESQELKNSFIAAILLSEDAQSSAAWVLLVGIHDSWLLDDPDDATSLLDMPDYARSYVEDSFLNELIVYLKGSELTAETVEQLLEVLSGIITELSLVTENDHALFLIGIMRQIEDIIGVYAAGYKAGERRE